MNDNVIFFGNGLNLLSKGALSWNELLNTIASEKDKVITAVPNTLQYEDLYLNNKVKLDEKQQIIAGREKELEIKCKIGEKLSEFESNEVFMELV